MRIINNLKYKKFLLLFFSYGLSAFLFSDFKLINNFYYLRLFIPSIVIFLCFVISYKTIVLTVNYYTQHKKYYVTGVMIILVFLTITLAYAIKHPSIQFDTWQVFDTSKFVFSDFGRMDMIRQHIFNTPYETGFPPLYPFMMALLNAFFNFGVFSSVVINFIVCFLLFYFLIKIGNYSQNLLISIIISGLLLFNPEMSSCYVGGSTIPLSILFFVITSYIVLKNINHFNIKNVIVLSFISGLGVLNRFDYLPVAVALGILVMVLNKKISIKFIIVYFAWFALMISPWILYSKLHFGNLFITDNGRRLINILDTRPSSFFSKGNPALTLFDNPGYWFKESLKRWVSAIKGLYTFISTYTYLKELLISFITLVAFGLLRIKFNAKMIKSNICKNKALYILFIPIILQTAAIILTGYPDVRYHILISFFMFYIILWLLFDYLMSNNVNKSKSNNIAFVLIITFCAISPKLDTYFLEKKAYLLVKILYANSNTTSFLVISENLDVYNYLGEKDNPRIIINRAEQTLDLPKFAALSNQVTIMSPTNIDVNNAKDFVEFFELNYLYSSDENQVDIFKTTMNVTPTEIAHLYKLEGIERDMTK
jgi:uncharacterized membrane protein YwzB